MERKIRLLGCNVTPSRMKKLEEETSSKIFYDEKKEVFVFCRKYQLLEIKDIDFVRIKDSGDLESVPYDTSDYDPNRKNTDLENIWNDIELEEEKTELKLHEKMYCFGRYLNAIYNSLMFEHLKFSFLNKLYFILKSMDKFKDEKLPQGNNIFSYLHEKTNYIEKVEILSKIESK